MTRKVTASPCEVLTGCGIQGGIDDFPTHKSARLRLERFWKERAMERKTKRWSDGHCSNLTYRIVWTRCSLGKERTTFDHVTALARRLQARLVHPRLALPFPSKFPFRRTSPAADAPSLTASTCQDNSVRDSSPVSPSRETTSRWMRSRLFLLIPSFVGSEPQGGPKIKKTDQGLFFFNLTSVLGLTKYVSGRLSIYGNGTSIYG